MRHGELDDLEPEPVCPSEHLRVHEEAGAFGDQLCQSIASKDLEGTIDIANARPEQGPNEPVVPPGEEPPPQWVFAINPVSNDNRRGFQMGCETFQIG